MSTESDGSVVLLLVQISFSEGYGVPSSGNCSFDYYSFSEFGGSIVTVNSN